MVSFFWCTRNKHQNFCHYYSFHSYHSKSKCQFPRPLNVHGFRLSFQRCNNILSTLIIKSYVSFAFCSWPGLRKNTQCHFTPNMRKTCLGVRKYHEVSFTGLLHSLQQERRKRCLLSYGSCWGQRQSVGNLCAATLFPTPLPMKRKHSCNRTMLLAPHLADVSGNIFQKSFNIT